MFLFLLLVLSDIGSKTVDSHSNTLQVGLFSSFFNRFIAINDNFMLIQTYRPNKKTIKTHLLKFYLKWDEAFAKMYSTYSF